MTTQVLAPRWRAIVLFAQMSTSYFRRNTISLVMTLAIPVIFLLLYSYAYYLSAPASKVGIGIASNLPLLSGQLDLAADSFRIAPDLEDAEAAVRKEQQRFGIARATDGAIVIFTNKFDRPIAELLMHQISASNKDASVRLNFVDAQASPLFFLPSIIIMSLLNLGLFTAGAKVLQERAASTLRLYRMLPLPFWTYFTAEFLTKLVLGLAITVLFLLCASLLLDTGLTWQRVALTLATAGLVSAAFVSLGLAIACVLGRYSSGVHVFTVVNLIIVFFGDLFFPASKFPLTKMIAMMMPTTYSVDLFKGLILNTPFRIAPLGSVAYLVGFSVVMFAIAVTSFKYTAKE